MNTFSLKSVLLEGPTGTWHQAEQSEDGKRLRCLVTHTLSSETQNCIYELSFFFFYNE